MRNIPRYFRIKSNAVYVGLDSQTSMTVLLSSLNGVKKHHIVLFKDDSHVHISDKYLKRLSEAVVEDGKKVVIHLIGFKKSEAPKIDCKGVKVLREWSLTFNVGSEQFLFKNNALYRKSGSGLAHFYPYIKNIEFFTTVPLENTKVFLFNKRFGFTCDDNWRLTQRGLIVDDTFVDMSDYEIIVGERVNVSK